MSMERFRRVAQLWNWLPAFRGVAEHESIHKAAAALATSPSALSRTVKLLEDAAGVELFARRGAGIVLTEAGSRLLSATRDAMRLVDDALSSFAQNVASTRLRIGVVSPTASALAALALGDLPAFQVGRPTVVNIQDDAVLEGLLRGDLDLVLTPSASTGRDVVIERAGDAEIGVYAAPSHHLARAAAQPSAEFADVTSCGFVVREGDDGWPIERPRNIVASTPSLEGVLAYCASREVVTCLPDVVAQRLVGPSLVRIADAGRQSLYLLRRKPIESQAVGAIDAVASSVRRWLDRGAG